MKTKNTVMLVIMDGFGCSDDVHDNAVAAADLKVLPKLWKEYPHSYLEASAEAVGLPHGQIGNSEVGHLNIGAGRIVYQSLTKITNDIGSGAFFEKEALVGAMEQAKAHNGALHLMGLVSPGGVHSSERHLYGLLEMAKRSGVKNVYIHAFLDGRDVLPRSAELYIRELEDRCAALGVGEIATVSGRYYAMDRDRRWERTEKAYNAVVYGSGETAATAQACLAASYEKGLSDEFVLPTVIHKHCLKDGDSVIFFNFRPDRARQLTTALAADDFDGFVRPEKLRLYVATMTRYEDTLPVHIVYDKEHLANTLGEVLAKAGKKQLRIAETEKYAHVTYFFNGGEEAPNEGEDRILVPSPKVATYDLQPEMNAPAVTEKAVAAIHEGTYDMIILNFANPDMVGHTGVLPAAVKAVETVDTCIGKIAEALRSRGGHLLIIADHGNAERMTDTKTGSPYTAHTTNHVPCILFSDAWRGGHLHDGILADVAPTLLYLAGMKQPQEMTGHNLLDE
ncbi:2,3-bisphosphoglycerate-independent phosphoglycerate mutase [Megasphaera vaginalis (ex Bordigoni et al. 2020)]|uniref:2,3-bisphosphoglycerate-independent phosphoglycerate mutase n=1 Tax=Megasphaera vaginalis (ex Bordigoni et al. 2020) TaxID=2045301 RepID=UPI000C79FD1A|nr:2,3-bisphosphoglycerate-independent phosphoglycerate mutase [Megasphaera vaginalis (ex Bordigoni et al. 2020)]